MQALKSVFERRTIFLGKDIGSDFDFVIRTDCHEPVVEGRVVDLAHGDAIWDDRFTPLGVTTNVRSV